MILLYNVCVTPDKSSYRLNYNRGLLPSFDKIDILKYSLYSISVIPWHKAFINIELKSYYKIFEKDIIKLIETEFANIDYELSFKRCSLQKDWQKISEKLLSYSKQNLFYCGNHDHIFMSPNLNLLNYCDFYLNNSNSIYDSICYSHRDFYHEAFDDIDINFCNGKWNSFDAMCCFKIRTFWEFWNSFDGSNQFLPRSDWAGVSEQNIIYDIKSPHHVFCEHFDGSAYYASYNINNNPALVIPQGFFENDIKIQIGGIKNEKYFYLNPLLDNHSCLDINGSDAFWSFEDIPLFWKNKISEVKIFEDQNSDDFKLNLSLKKLKTLYPNSFENCTLNQKIELIEKYKNILFSESINYDLHKLLDKR